MKNYVLSGMALAGTVFIIALVSLGEKDLADRFSRWIDDKIDRKIASPGSPLVSD